MNKKILLTLVAVIATFTAMAQGRMDMCINEVMVQNGSCADQNGKCQAWVELFNASYGTNAIEKMFITTFKQDYIQDYFKKMESKSNKKRNVLLEELRDQYPDKVYEIPRGDVDTKIKPRTHVVFYADGDTTAGTLHLSFTRTPASDNYIALYDVNGDLVDEVARARDCLATCTRVATTASMLLSGRCATALLLPRPSPLASSMCAP